LTECLLLSGAGGALGVLLALWGVDLLLGLGPRSLPRAEEIHVDGFVLGFSVALTAAAAFVFGLLPALHASRVDLNHALRGRAAGGRRPRRLRRALVAAEVALALVLVASAGLVTKSFARVLAVDPGFPVDGLLTMRVTLPTPNGPDTDADHARYARFYA